MGVTNFDRIGGTLSGGVGPATATRGRPLARRSVTLTMAAGAEVDGQISYPAGSEIIDVLTTVATAFSGSPTNINFSAGNVADGAQYVAATDVKAAGRIRHSLASTAASELISGPGTLHCRLVASGGTSPAGTAVVTLVYAPPIS